MIFWLVDSAFDQSVFCHIQQLFNLHLILNKLHENETTDILGITMAQQWSKKYNQFVFTQYLPPVFILLQNGCVVWV